MTDIHSEPFFTYAEPCENCGTPCESRVWIPGFNYWACDECAYEVECLIFAEENCPTLYHAIMKATTVGQVRLAFNAHKAGCPRCKPGVTPALPEAA